MQHAHAFGREVVLGHRSHKPVSNARSSSGLKTWISPLRDHRPLDPGDRVRRQAPSLWLIAECGLDMTRFPTAGTSPPGPGSVLATTSPRDEDAPDAPAPARSG